MSAPSPADIMQGVSGQLCAAPTSLATAFPHGGTALGIVRDVKWRFMANARLIRAEEYAGTVVEALDLDRGGILACVLRSWDDDAIAAVFPDTAAGETSGRRMIRGRASTNTVRGGTKASGRATKLLFSPDQEEEFAVLLYSAIPLVEATAELELAIGREVGIPIVWHCIPNADGQLYEIGLLEDLTL